LPAELVTNHNLIDAETPGKAICTRKCLSLWHEKQLIGV